MPSMEQLFDVTTGDTLAEAGQKMVQSFSEKAGEGYEVVSISHAVDVSGNEPKWSIMILYRRLRD